MAEPKAKPDTIAPGRVRMIGPDGKQYSVRADQVDRAMNERQLLPADDTGQPDRGMISTIWDKMNAGIISPNRALQILTLGKQGTGTKETVEELEKESTGPPRLSETPEQAFNRVFVQGLRASEGRALSSMTSPISLGTAGLGKLAKIPGALGTIAKVILATQGIGFGLSGAGDVIEGVSEGAQSPQGAEKILTGVSQVLGALPAAEQVKRGTQAAISRLLPGVYARNDRAFIASMRPPLKQAPALRDAYNLTRGELQKANVKDFGDLRNFAEKQRTQVAANTMSELVKRSPAGGAIDAKSVGDAVRKRITPWMKVRAGRSPRGTPVLPPEAEAIRQEANNIERNMHKQPVTLVQAEKIVQDINANLTTFRKLSPDVQYQAIRSGDPVAVMTAVKEQLQSQIESKLSGYKDLKARYGAYKEIQNHTERRMDQLDRELGGFNWEQRRAVEGLGGAMGAIFSGDFLRGFADILAGRASGDVGLELARRPERLLRRSFLPPRRPIPFGGQVVQPVASGMQKPEEEQ